jgi:pre-mRNA-splicing factor SYF2
MRQKVDADERGEDIERYKNWEWTIEENEEWEKRQARKNRRADFAFHSKSYNSHCQFARLSHLFSDDSHAARRKYKKDLDHLKPDLVAYNRQKEIAMGLAPGTLVRTSEGSSSMQVSQMCS